MKLNVIREAEVETITKSIQGKVNEVKRTMAQPTDATSTIPSMQQNSLPVGDHDITSAGSELFKVHNMLLY